MVTILRRRLSLCYRLPMHPALSLPSLLRLGLIAALLACAAACAETDIGAPCSIHKDRLDPTIPGCASVTPDEVKERPECFRPTIEDLTTEAAKEKDFISFGATECDNLTCVRSTDDTLTQKERHPASERDFTGYCSGECINDQDCESERGKFICRPLVFDDEFIHHLQDTLSAEEYARYMGRVQNAKFCARAQGEPDDRPSSAG